MTSSDAGGGAETEESADRAVPRVSFGSSDDADEPEVTHQTTQDGDERDLQEENAETSLDQPST